MARSRELDGMWRYGINTTNRLGVRVPELRMLAKACGRDQKLAEELWATGIPDARILASFVGDPAEIRPATMDKWARDFDCWTVCDAAVAICSTALRMRGRRSGSGHRTIASSCGGHAFATLAALAVYDKNAGDREFLEALKLIEEYSFDDRNFVRKVVNLSLRNIGERNARLRVACNRRREADSRSGYEDGTMDRLRRAARMAEEGGAGSEGREKGRA